MTGSSIVRLKSILDGCVGSRVRFNIKKGRKKTPPKEGILTGTYPSIFTVNVAECKGSDRVMAFNYIDILTNHVEIFLLDSEETRIV